MGEFSADALFREIRTGAVEPVYYLHGEEDVLKDEAVRAIADRVLEPSTRDFNLDQPDPAGLDAERLHALLNTPPMLAERRLVILRGLAPLRRKSRARDVLLRYIAAPSPATVLVLIDPPRDKPGDKPDPDLQRHAAWCALDRLPPASVARWIARRAEGLGLALEPDAAAHLATVLDGSLGGIAQELDKLRSAVAGRPAARADVESLVGVRHGETLPDLVAAALERRAAEAARLVTLVLMQPGVTGVRIVMALGTALVGTALARAELDRGTAPGRLAAVLFGHLRAARPFGLGDWKATTADWARWAGAWRAAELRVALRMTLAADHALKETRLSSDAGIVTGLVLGWAAIAREAA